MHRVGIDTGGTFTDAVSPDGAGGFKVYKCATTPREPARAVLTALAELASTEQPVELVHGTTHATNALLTGTLGRVALLTTAGFADLLAIGRQHRDQLYALEPHPVRPVQNRKWVFEVQERLAADGRVLEALTDAEIARLFKQVKRAKPQAIAIALLHAYRDGRHERRLGRALKKLGLPVFLSCEVAPEYREFERATTTWADAALAPVVGPAMAVLDRQVQQTWGAASRVRIMRSDGGTASAAAAGADPVHLALSGPAGGLSAAATLAQARSDGAILTLDMGGTSTDVALLGEGELPLGPVEIGGLCLLARGLPIHSVGTGGGSLADWDQGGALQVGPDSAGAEPGPICYQRGGQRVTVTDAHLVAGRLHPQYFLGGQFELEISAARTAMKNLGKPSGMNALQTARAVLEVATADMERALRRISLAEGHDPRSLCLYAFGGAGGLHAAWLAGLMDMRRVLIPPHAGAFSAVGLLAAPARRTLVQAVLQELPGVTARRHLFQPLIEQAKAELKAEGVPSSRIQVRRILELRSVGQAAEFALPEGPRLLERFHDEHYRRFGYRRTESPVLLVNLRLMADGPLQSPWQKRRLRRVKAQPLDKRPAIFPENQGEAMASWYRREDLSPGAFLAGPAVVAEYSGTTVVPKGWTANIDAYGALELSR
jgi:N-methylhydantoinase A